MQAAGEEQIASQMQPRRFLFVFVLRLCMPVLETKPHALSFLSGRQQRAVARRCPAPGTVFVTRIVRGAGRAHSLPTPRAADRALRTQPRRYPRAVPPPPPPSLARGILFCYFLPVC